MLFVFGWIISLPSAFGCVWITDSNGQARTLKERISQQDHNCAKSPSSPTTLKVQLLSRSKLKWVLCPFITKVLHTLLKLFFSAGISSRLHREIILWGRLHCFFLSFLFSQACSCCLLQKKLLASRLESSALSSSVFSELCDHQLNFLVYWLLWFAFIPDDVYAVLGMVQ